MDTRISLQVLQTANLTLLVSVAYGYGTLPIPLIWFAVVLIVAESADLMLQKGRRHLSFSALTTAMGVALMLYATQWWIYPLAILAAIGQKYRLRYRRAHLFNPSNFAIVLMLLLFPDRSALHLGVLGENTRMLFAVLAIGTATLYIANRLLLPLVYLLSYTALSYLCVVGPDPVAVWEDIVWRFYPVSTIVFILFMVTDPRTTPQRWYGQTAFAFCVAAVAVAQDTIFVYSAVHPFTALFVVTPAYILSREKCQNLTTWAIWFFSVFTVIIATHALGVHTVSEAIYY